MTRWITADLVFDGRMLHANLAIGIENGRIAALKPADRMPRGPVPRTDRAPLSDHLRGIVAPGFVDLQVNGGAGLMVGPDTDADALRRICAAHRRLGCAGVLPTLITDRPETTARLIDAAIRAEGTPGLLGLHLEGPHLDPRRAGAHDPALIRPMTPEDLAMLCRAARDLPALMVTLAPESVTPDQIHALSRAGAVVSLGHSDCSHEAAAQAIAAGARCATHLFNAMSQLGHRQPGLVGAVLSSDIHAGLIADGVHVSVPALRIALAARAQGLFLVSDCMAVADTDATEFTLQSRRILRRDGRLTLADGTLAGADLRLDRAMQVAMQAGASRERALAMATRIPADLIGAGHAAGRLDTGRGADLVLLDHDLGLRATFDGQDWAAV
ncbi:N-acetylglucosamine-6-phosphate deacetylase [Paracoccus sp. 1_MG-2023]|uniref:N-acetylglucosamine-6-phosphate deacetylase n=1 Tax=unclassified Paracoccus (in: a-proteobacteria) TaxID=2688777 RepID=UPI001C084CA9|nr:MULTISPECIES: N-acetylglucosamine-6-phosphate deacetylase [unclassified Paracoccus (in: a-proteobacteria)]MBU2956228.1 N-acetylglucosamine-6-phosphate deacetylase [Paracoccus sp. C2R09]MDO6667905.1 N-acetylglucosamine-6-phosphate deacetylase [Paracoccus sp. 1_MG-2023]